MTYPHGSLMLPYLHLDESPTTTPKGTEDLWFTIAIRSIFEFYDTLIPPIPLGFFETGIQQFQKQFTYFFNAPLKM